MACELVLSLEKLMSHFIIELDQRGIGHNQCVTSLF